MKIYQIDTTDFLQSHLYQHAWERLSEIERKKISAIQTQKQRLLSLGARILLQYALAKENIRQYELAIGKHGKPFLKNHTLQFNLSHSQTSVVCVIAEEAVGIDLEEKTRTAPKQYEKIVSQEEKQFLQESNYPDIDFLRIWTMKESFVKMQGGRIFEKPKEISMVEDMQLRTVWAEQHCFLQRYETAEYLICVCAKQNQFPKTITKVTQRDITDFLQLYE